MKNFNLVLDTFRNKLLANPRKFLLIKMSYCAIDLQTLTQVIYKSLRTHLFRGEQTNK